MLIQNKNLQYISVLARKEWTPLSIFLVPQKNYKYHLSSIISSKKISMICLTGKEQRQVIKIFIFVYFTEITLLVGISFARFIQETSRVWQLPSWRWISCWFSFWRYHPQFEYCYKNPQRYWRPWFVPHYRHLQVYRWWSSASRARFGFRTEEWWCYGVSIWWCQSLQYEFCWFSCINCFSFWSRFRELDWPTFLHIRNVYYRI